MSNNSEMKSLNLTEEEINHLKMILNSMDEMYTDELKYPSEYMKEEEHQELVKENTINKSLIEKINAFMV